jgi:AcrR family transcriptional regulator
MSDAPQRPAESQRRHAGASSKCGPCGCPRSLSVRLRLDVNYTESSVMTGRPRSGSTVGLARRPSHVGEERPLRPPIPRGEYARERLLRAALEVLAERGLGGFTIEAVAQRAGASKATIYRRWESPGQLLVDAMDASFRPFPLPATGRLRTDLIELLTRFQALLSGRPFPQLMAAFIDAAERDPTLSRLHLQLTERRREPLRQVLVKARLRGEIPSTADLELAIDLLASPAFYRRFIAHQELPRNYPTAVVDYVLRAVGHADGKPRKRQ